MLRKRRTHRNATVVIDGLVAYSGVVTEWPRGWFSVRREVGPRGAVGELHLEDGGVQRVFVDGQMLSAYPEKDSPFPEDAQRPRT